MERTLSSDNIINKYIDRKSFYKNQTTGSFKISIYNIDHQYQFNVNQKVINLLIGDYTKDSLKIGYSFSPFIGLVSLNNFTPVITKILKNGYEILILNKLTNKIDERIEIILTEEDKHIILEDLKFIKKHYAEHKEFMESSLNYLKVKKLEDVIYIGFKNSFLSVKINERKFNLQYNKILNSKTNEFVNLDISIKVYLKDYLGKTKETISDLLKEVNSSKTVTNNHIKQILNGNTKGFPDEFYKSGITIKTVVINKNGTIKESVPFPTFDFHEIIETVWEKSDIYYLLKNYKFLFVIFQEQDDKQIFIGTKLWSMPLEDLQGYVRQAWLHTVQIIKSGKITKGTVNNRQYTNFIGTSENKVVHVRPHAANKLDRIPLPVQDVITGDSDYMKHSFWLNSQYIKEEIFNNKFDNYLLNTDIKKTSNATKDTVMIYNQNKCNEDYYVKDNLCYLKKFKNLYDAIMSEVNTKPFFVLRIKDENYIKEFNLIKAKEIVIEISKDKYITPKFFEDKLLFWDSVRVFNLLNKVKNNTPVEASYIRSKIDVLTFDSLLNNLKMELITFNNIEYITLRKRFNNSQAVKFIMQLYNIQSASQLKDNVLKLIDINLDTNQLKNASRLARVHFDADLDMYFINIDQYYKYIWSE